MLKVAGMVNKFGHYNGVGRFGSLHDDLVGCPTCGPAVQCWNTSGDSIPCDVQAYSIYGDSCADSDGNWVNCPGDISSNGGYAGPSETVATDNGNAQQWAQIIASAGKIAAQVLTATSTQYRTPYGTYAYGTGPYSGLTPSLAQQYLASRSSLGGMSTTTMLLIGGGLLLALMAMKR